MANPKKDFINIHLSREDYEAYIDWANAFQNTYKTRFHKGALAKLFREGVGSMKELKLLSNINVNLAHQDTHTSQKMYSGIGILHARVVEKINKKYGFDQLEDKSTIKIAHQDILLMIQEVFKIKDRRPINQRRDEILNLLGLETIQEKGKWWVVDRLAYQPNAIDDSLLLSSREEKELQKEIKYLQRKYLEIRSEPEFEHQLPALQAELAEAKSKLKAFQEVAQ